MSPVPLSAGATSLMAPTRAPAQLLSAATTSMSTATTAAIAATATAGDKGDSVQMVSQDAVGSANDNSNKIIINNNNNNTNNTSEKTDLTVSMPAAQQQQPPRSSNDFITNFFNNLRSTKQQQRRESDTKNDRRQQHAAVSTTATTAATTTTAAITDVETRMTYTTTKTKFCDSSSNNNISSANITSKSEDNVATTVAIKTEKELSSSDNNQQPTSPASISSSAQPSTATSSPLAAPNKKRSNAKLVSENKKDEEDEDEDDGDSNSLIFAKPRPVLLSAVNPHIICNLCHGYLIDATTIVECLHSFCHSCIMKHLRTEQYCPRCEMMINTAKPNIKPDTTLQAIVYKLVPGLYEKELMRKRAFYRDKPQEAALATPEQRGDDTEHLIFSPSEYMSLSLEYADIEEHIGSSRETEFVELLKPKFLQCPSICSVAHLKKFVYGKFNIDTNLYDVDIMYKVKTIVLLDHYSLMDVAYIYTWKRDAPMRFYFRVRETSRRALKVRKAAPAVATKQEVLSDQEEPRRNSEAMTVVHEATPSLDTDAQPLAQIKVEEAEPEAVEPPPPSEEKTFEIIPQSSLSSNCGTNSELSKTDKLKITIVSKGSRDKLANSELKSPGLAKPSKDKKDTAVPEFKDERKVENIKLKIDLSKQNSVTIINMSDPDRKEVVKPVKVEREWKVKSKKDKGDSPKCSPNSDRERKRKSPSPLTVPPLTIKAERFSPPAKTSPTSHSPKEESSIPPSLFKTDSEEEEKSEFLKSFALTPIKDIKIESPEKTNVVPKLSPPKIFARSPMPLHSPLALMKPPTCMLPKFSISSKRKSKEPLKAITKKPKFAAPVPPDDFKIKLPLSSSLPNKVNKSLPPPSSTDKDVCVDKPLMPPPAPLSVMRPPCAPPRKPTKSNKPQSKFAPPGSLTPHPSQGFQPAPVAPGNRTPIAKRYQPILPKASRPNPFANIPNDVNKILKDAGTEIKSISSNDAAPPKVVYGPKTPQKNNMSPPAAPTASVPATPNGNRGMTAMKSTKSNGSNNYLNLALFNSSKSRGNEAPPGCRTPMYSPNSPIYSPSSPQYSPNYNISTMPTYKYTPKPSSVNSSYFQSMLGNNSQMSSLFPAPPTKKPSTENVALPNSSSPLKTPDQSQKRVYPFSKSPSPVEDPPEKQLKVKSLLTSCNINIPSSLSITITREDAESQANNTSYPKHNSPVNNYIEILKLPDQSMEARDASWRSSPPKQVPTPQPKKETSNASPQSKGPQNLMHQLPSTPNNGTSKPDAVMKSMNLSFSGPPVSMQNINATSTMTKSTPAANNKPTKSTNSKTNPLPSSNMCGAKPQVPPTPQPNATKAPKVAEVSSSTDKKTPSPEKRPAQNNTEPTHSPPSTQAESKSPKSPNSESAAAQAAKKFRHILPRQNPTPIPEVIPPKVTAGNIIGTYSSPSGVAVKVHANKKVPPSKKSPNNQQLPQDSAAGNNKACTPMTSPNPTQPSAKPATGVPPANPLKNCNTNKGKKPLPSPTSTAATNCASKQLPGPHAPLNSLPGLPPHPMQTLPNLSNLPNHLGMPGNTTNQAELSQIFKDNLLRAQVQAAAANQSNMFYSYANAAAQMSQFAPSMYNYQQAYIMEQLSRMQRAGNEAFVEYMQKLKSSGIDKPPPSAHDVGESRNPALTVTSSPKTSPTVGQKSPQVQAKTKAK